MYIILKQLKHPIRKLEENHRRRIIWFVIHACNN